MFSLSVAGPWQLLFQETCTMVLPQLDESTSLSNSCSISVDPFQPSYVWRSRISAKYDETRAFYGVNKDTIVTVLPVYINILVSIGVLFLLAQAVSFSVSYVPHHLKARQSPLYADTRPLPYKSNLSSFTASQSQSAPSPPQYQ